MASLITHPKKFNVHLSEAPMEVIGRIIGDKNFVVRPLGQVCNCGRKLRAGSTLCPYCGSSVRPDLCYSVKLAHNGVHPHGVSTFLLSKWNPAEVLCTISESAGECEVEVQLVGAFASAEFVAFAVICGLISSFAIYTLVNEGHFTNPLHYLFLLALPLGPFGARHWRHDQEERLLKFVLGQLESECNAKLDSSGTSAN